MKAGDIALASLPQANREIKKRPVVILKTMPPFGDLLVCGISTQLRHEVREFDDIINESDSDFNLSGLKKPSLIRMGYLLTLPFNQMNGSEIFRLSAWPGCGDGCVNFSSPATRRRFAPHPP